MATDHDVHQALATVEDPDIERSILTLGMVRAAVVTGNRAGVLLALPAADHPHVDELRARVDRAVAAVPGLEGADVELTVMSEDEQKALRIQLIGSPEATAGSQPAHGHAEGRAIPIADASSASRILLIASGKGGVGKSSITANLAVAMTQRGRRVAVIDADVWGFSIPRMLGVERPPTVIDQMIVPPSAHGVRVVSMGFFAREDQPVIWRGPMLHKALEQFLTDVFWNEPDYLLIDLPPGTGDISLSISQFVPRAEAIVVTTPQPAAQRVAQRAAFMFEKVRIDVRGVIENMSWFRGDDGKRYELFGSGGGQELADRLEVPLLGQVPLVPALREGSDTGLPVTVSDPEGEAGRVFAEIARALDEDLKPTKRYRAELRLG
jgi:ATP-binding protein involved in chromosome partitioning